MTLSTPCYSGIHFVGNVILFHGEYSPNQLWFDFAKGILFKTETQPALPASMSSNEFQRRKQEEKIKPDNKFVYKYDEMPQLVLPFIEHKRVVRSQKATLTALNHPGWDRDDAGNLHTLELLTKKPSHFNYISELCLGQYFTSGMSHVTFQFASDAVIYRLTGKEHV